MAEYSREQRKMHICRTVEVKRNCQLKIVDNRSSISINSVVQRAPEFTFGEDPDRYTGDEIGGYSRRSIRGIVVTGPDRIVKKFEIRVDASENIHRGEGRKTFYLQILRGCAGNWTTAVGASFTHKGYVVTRIQ